MSFFYRSAWPAIRLKGQDRLDYLHRLTSQSFRDAKVGEACPAAFLTAKGSARALFLAWIREDDVTMLCEPESLQELNAAIDSFHFGESIEWSKVTDVSAVEVFGTEVPMSVKPQFWSPFPGVSGLFVGMDSSDFSSELLSALNNLGPRLNEEERWQKLVELGVPRFGVDITSENIIVESAAMEGYIHRNKGCYPGQEVIERIATYGNVAKRIVRVQASGLADSLPQDLQLEDRVVGKLTSLWKRGSEYTGMATIKRLEIQTGRRFRVKPARGSDTSAWPEVWVVDQ